VSLDLSTTAVLPIEYHIDDVAPAGMLNDAVACEMNEADMFADLRTSVNTARKSGPPVLLLLWLAALAAGCGGGAPTQPTPAIPPREALPELRSMTIAFSDDAPPASRNTSASVMAVDHRGQSMTVGLVAWTSSDTTIATISSDGTILARRPGTTTIGAAIGVVTSRRALSVLPPPPGPLPVVSVVVSPLTTTLGVGQSQQLTAMLRDFANTVLTDREIAWASSDDAVAVVSASGIVTARGQGEAVIEAVSEGKRSGAVITVKAAVDPNISVIIAAPLNGAAFADSVRMYVSVRSVLPVDSVIVVIAGRSTPLRLVLTPNIAGTIDVPSWEANVDISSSPYGTLAVVVTATDVLGRRAVAVSSIVRNPGLTPGSKSPPASK